MHEGVIGGIDLRDAAAVLAKEAAALSTLLWDRDVRKYLRNTCATEQESSDAARLPPSRILRTRAERGWPDRSGAAKATSLHPGGNSPTLISASTGGAPQVPAGLRPVWIAISV